MNIQFNVDSGSIERAISDLLANITDSQTMLEIHQALAKRCDPYVPYRTGDLANSGLSHVTADGVHYTMDYASEQYYGVGIQHNPSVHPKATALWDKVMLQEQGEEFIQEIKEIIERRMRENGK